MRRDSTRLEDVLKSADQIERFLRDSTREHFLGDEILQAAVLQKLLVIGEATSRITRRFRSSHPEIEWQEVIAFRNFAIHAYFNLEWSVVWTTSTVDVPVLRQKVAALLSQPGLFGSDTTDG